MNKFAYDLPKDLYKGMRVRPTMDSIANYIEKDPYRIKYPNRDASFYLNSPQFLNLLNDSGLDLQEQSEALSKQQLMQAQVTAAGKGGVVDRAVDTGTTTTDVGTNVYEGQMQPESLRKKRLRVSFIAAAKQRMAEQEAARQEQQRILAEQVEAQRKMAEDQRIRAQQMAAASAASSSSHPIAASAAQQFSIASPPSGSGSPPSLLIGTRDVIYTPTPGAPFASQLSVQPKTDVSMQERVQTKRLPSKEKPSEDRPESEHPKRGRGRPEGGGFQKDRSVSARYHTPEDEVPQTERRRSVSVKRALTPKEQNSRQYWGSLTNKELANELRSHGITSITVRGGETKPISRARHDELVDAVVKIYEKQGSVKGGSGSSSSKGPTTGKT